MNSQLTYLLMGKPIPMPWDNNKWRFEVEHTDGRGKSERTSATLMTHNQKRSADARKRFVSGCSHTEWRTAEEIARLIGKQKGAVLKQANALTKEGMLFRRKQIGRNNACFEWRLKDAVPELRIGQEQGT